jgi:hypothetical protein
MVATLLKAQSCWAFRKAEATQAAQEEALVSPRQSASAYTTSGAVPADPFVKRAGDEEAFLGKTLARTRMLAW